MTEWTPHSVLAQNPRLNNAISSFQGEGLLQMHSRERASHKSPLGLGGRLRALADRSQCPGMPFINFFQTFISTLDYPRHNDTARIVS